MARTSASAAIIAVIVRMGRVAACDHPVTACRPYSCPMTENQRTVERYLDGFRTSNHTLVLSCLTDDVEWVLPGGFHLNGKEAFDGEIENDAFTGSPVITISRTTEENDVVIAEGD